MNRIEHFEAATPTELAKLINDFHRNSTYQPISISAYIGKAGAYCAFVVVEPKVVS